MFNTGGTPADTSAVTGPTAVPRRLLDAAGVALVRLDDEGRIGAANPAFAQLAGRAVGELVGLHVLALCPGRDQAEVLAAIVRVVGGVHPVEHADLAVRAADGNDRLLGLTLGPVEAPDGRVAGIDAVAVDVTRLRRDDRRRRREAVAATRNETVDAVTGLVQGRGLDLLLAGAARRSRHNDTAHALLHCALDGPDGAPAGPAAVALVAERLRQVLRPGDTVALVGDGDEQSVLVVAEDLRDAQDAAGVAYRLLAALVTPVRADDAEVVLTMSVGIAVATGVAATDGDLAADARRAAGWAREDGGGGFRLAPHGVPDVIGS